MASQTVMQQIKAAERQVRSQVAMCIMDVSEACRTQLQNLLGLVRTSTSLTQDHCTDVLEYLKSDQGTFSHEERLEMAKVTNARYMSLALCRMALTRRSTSTFTTTTQNGYGLSLSQMTPWITRTSTRPSFG